MKVKNLGEIVKTNHRIGHQVYREGKQAIYEFKNKNEHFFEAIIIRTVKPTGFRAEAYNEYDLIEVYPSTEDWGRYGKTCGSFEQAKRALIRLTTEAE